MEKIILEKVTMYRDGGTILYMQKGVKDSIKTKEDFENASKYYLDGRIGSSTRDELFDRYPRDGSAVMLNKEDFEFPLN